MSGRGVGGVVEGVNQTRSGLPERSVEGRGNDEPELGGHGDGGGKGK